MEPRLEPIDITGPANKVLAILAVIGTILLWANLQ
ncbi:hypothetical protein METEAL_15000 [Mesoterricola silvestris]|uniref:Uncharacterized protein n=1 Tax=Mesoterricola silvestris TaxID=2927979 RepID=A0AA48GGF0_9BACT|nr:hypothetical protein METEAL_15000 [Mesoterricola silvestris]